MKDRCIAILGFMGSGKTTVAAALARELDCEMLDLDSFITKREGRSPAEIIQTEGEPVFRELETLALSEALPDGKARVIALGGGTWTIPANRSLIASHKCLSVWLDAPFELCWQRILASSKTIRPLAPDRETARQRYAARSGDYALAKSRITVSGSDTPEAIVNKILKRLT